MDIAPFGFPAFHQKGRGFGNYGFTRSQGKASGYFAPVMGFPFLNIERNKLNCLRISGVVYGFPIDRDRSVRFTLKIALTAANGKHELLHIR
jgi:hypothetical protein